MKKEYSAPIVEKIAFNYRDQVVAASGGQSGGGDSTETPIVDPSPKTNGWGAEACGYAVYWTEALPFIPGCIAD